MAALETILYEGINNKFKGSFSDSLNIAHSENLEAQQKYSRKAADIEHDFNLELATALQKRLETDALAWQEREHKFHELQKAYDDSMATYGRELRDSRLNAQQALAEAGAQAQFAFAADLAEATRVLTIARATANETYANSVAVAQADYWIEVAQARVDAVNTHFGSGSDEYTQKELQIAQHALSYAQSLKPGYQAFESDKAAARRFEVVQNAYDRENRDNAIADAKLQAALDAAAAEHAFGIARSEAQQERENENAELWRTEQEAEADAETQYRITLSEKWKAHAEGASAADMALVKNGIDQAVAPHYETATSADIFNPLTLISAQPTAAAQQAHSGTRDSLRDAYDLAVIDAREERAKALTSAFAAYHIGYYTAEKGQIDAEAAAFIVRDQAIAGVEFGTPAAIDVLKLTYIVQAAENAKDRAMTVATLQETYTVGKASLQATQSSADAVTVQDYQLSLATTWQSQLASWNPSRHEAWAQYHRNLAQIEVTRLTAVGSARLFALGQQLSADAAYNSASAASTRVHSQESAANDYQLTLTRVNVEKAYVTAVADTKIAEAVAKSTALSAHDTTVAGHNLAYRTTQADEDEQLQDQHNHQAYQHARIVITANSPSEIALSDEVEHHKTIDARRDYVKALGAAKLARTIGVNAVATALANANAAAVEARWTGEVNSLQIRGDANQTAYQNYLDAQQPDDATYSDNVEAAGDARTAATTASRNAFEQTSTQISAGEGLATTQARSAYEYALYLARIPTASSGATAAAAIQQAITYQRAGAQAAANQSERSGQALAAYETALNNVQASQQLQLQTAEGELQTNVELADDAYAGLLRPVDNAWERATAGIDDWVATQTAVIKKRWEGVRPVAEAYYTAALVAADSAYGDAVAASAKDWLDAAADTDAERAKGDISATTAAERVAEASDAHEEAVQEARVTFVEAVGAAQIARADALGSALIAYATDWGNMLTSSTAGYNLANTNYSSAATAADSQNAAAVAAANSGHALATSDIQQSATLNRQQPQTTLHAALSQSDATEATDLAQAAATYAQSTTARRSTKAAPWRTDSNASAQQAFTGQRLQAQSQFVTASASSFLTEAASAAAASVSADQADTQAENTASSASAGALHQEQFQSQPQHAQRSADQAARRGASDRQFVIIDNAYYTATAAAEATFLLAKANRESQRLSAYATAQAAYQLALVEAADDDPRQPIHDAYQIAIAAAELDYQQGNEQLIGLAQALYNYQTAVAYADLAYAVAVNQLDDGDIQTENSADAALDQSLTRLWQSVDDGRSSANSNRIQQQELTSAGREQALAAAQAAFETAKLDAAFAAASGLGAASGTSHAQSLVNVVSAQRTAWNNGSFTFTAAQSVYDAVTDYWEAATAAQQSATVEQNDASADHNVNVAAAEQAYQQTLATADTRYLTAVAQLTYNYLSAAAAADRVHTLAVAQATYDHVVGLTEAEDQDDRDQANATFNQAVGQADAARNQVQHNAARAYVVKEAAAAGRRANALAQANLTYVQATTDSLYATTQRTTQSQYDYQVNESSLYVTRVQGVSSARSQAISSQSAAEAAAISSAVNGSTNPFDAFQASRLAASSTQKASVAAAEATSATAQANARKSADDARAAADKQSALARTTASIQEALSEARQLLSTTAAEAAAKVSDANSRTITPTELPKLAEAPKVLPDVNPSTSGLDYLPNSGDGIVGLRGSGWRLPMYDSWYTQYAWGIGGAFGTYGSLLNSGTMQYSAGHLLLTGAEVQGSTASLDTSMTSPWTGNHAHGVQGGIEFRHSDNGIRDNLKREYGSVDTPQLLMPLWKQWQNWTTPYSSGSLTDTSATADQNTGSSFGNGAWIPPAPTAPPPLNPSAQVANSGFYNACFVAGTPILTPYGSQPIESLKPGDRVWSRPEDNPSARPRIQIVEDTFHRTAATLRLHIGGRIIETTETHPFFVIDRGWTAASDLAVGDRIPSHNATESTIDFIEPGPAAPVFNVCVSEDHTYFVGNLDWQFSVWAHNAGDGYASSADSTEERVEDAPRDPKALQTTDPSQASLIASLNKTLKNWTDEISTTEIEKFDAEIAAARAMAANDRNYNNIYASTDNFQEFLKGIVKGFVIDGAWDDLTGLPKLAYQAGKYYWENTTPEQRAEDGMLLALFGPAGVSTKYTWNWLKSKYEDFQKSPSSTQSEFEELSTRLVGLVEGMHGLGTEADKAAFFYFRARLGMMAVRALVEMESTISALTPHEQGAIVGMLIYEIVQAVGAGAATAGTSSGVSIAKIVKKVAHWTNLGDRAKDIVLKVWKVVRAIDKASPADEIADAASKTRKGNKFVKQVADADQPNLHDPGDRLLLNGVDKWDEFLEAAKKLGCFVAGTPVEVIVPQPEWPDPSIEADRSFATSQTALQETATIATVTASLPIEDVPLGARSLAANPRPEPELFEVAEPDPVTWRRMLIEIARDDGAQVRIETLRSAQWIENLRLFPGCRVDIVYPEIRVQGRATITEIGPCPPIAAGPGAVVISRIATHNARELVRVRFADGTDLVGTPSHPVWDCQREDWVGLRHLLPGDHVLSAGHPLAVESVAPLSANEPVYNLEIQGEHVYEAGTSRILVHNTTAAQRCDEFLTELQQLEKKGAAGKEAAEKLVKERFDELWPQRSQLSKSQRDALKEMATRYKIGTLERDIGLNLNHEILGGVPEGYAGHHKISIKLAEKSDAAKRAAELGYNINRGSNGIALPTTIPEAIASGLPLHSGRHLSPRHAGSADAFVKARLDDLDILVRSGKLDGDELLAAMRKLEDDIDTALRQHRVRLQSEDPHWKP